MKFNVGSLVVEFAGSGDVHAEIIDEARALPQAEGTAALVFDIRPMGEAFKDGEVPGKQPSYDFEAGGFQCRFSKLENHVIVQCRSAAKTTHPRLKAVLQRARDWNYLTPPQSAAKNFWYDIFDWCVQIVQVEHEQTWVHASAVEKDGKAHLFLARGGVGKTTTLLKLCSTQEWKYLSDDLLVIDGSGQAFRSPKRMQIYPYNVENEPVLEKLLLQNRTVMDRMSYAYKTRRAGLKGARRRMSAEELFGTACAAHSGPIATAVFLERYGGSGVVLEDTPASRIAQRMAPIVSDEIEPYSRIQRFARSDLVDLFPQPDVIEAQSQGIIEAAIKDSRVMTAQIGSDVTPTQLAAALVGALRTAS